MRRELEALFARTIPGPDGCMLWTGAKVRGGYGLVKIKHKGHRTHRLAWELTNGTIPTNMCICHKCDRPSCINPEHLFCATQLENISDRHAKKRDGSAKGVAHARAKLTEKQVLEIRASPELQSVLVKRYGVNQSVISAIKRRAIWRHLP